MPGKEKEKPQTEDQNEDTPVKPDPETLHTTDPQDNMEGPVSSVVQSVKENMEDADADKKKE